MLSHNESICMAALPYESYITRIQMRKNIKIDKYLFAIISSKSLYCKGNVSSWMRLTDLKVGVKISGLDSFGSEFKRKPISRVLQRMTFMNEPRSKSRNHLFRSLLMEQRRLLDPLKTFLGILALVSPHVRERVRNSITSYGGPIYSIEWNLFRKPCTYLNINEEWVNFS